MIKDIYEDFIRKSSDTEENNTKTYVGKPAENLIESEEAFKFTQTIWNNVQVGQIIKVNQNENFPCDLLLLSSSLPNGMCYVETKNLDGETNLKHKKASKEITKLSEDAGDVSEDFKTKLIKTLTGATIECENENESIYTFSG